MNILLIEDNILKREKVASFLRTICACSLSEAASFNAGLNAALSGQYDALILDMSMPTFDRTETAHGGRFRSIAGKEIAIRLAKRGALIPFVILTGYKDFSVDDQNLSIDEIDESLKELGNSYKGYIMFDAAESLWKEKLSEIVRSLTP
ncbi:response regulator [Paraburkholderia hospita]|uniref:response regulator n=1 Tax=Paraburkholderia hospita TaxID=169430 RepID=UPI000F0A7E0E|nr:response regulator [Paraburkholderia hospita]